MVKGRYIDMTEGNLLKKIIVFTIPVILSGIIQLLFNACDLIIVGKFSGDLSLAAIGATSSLTSLIVNLFIGFSIGANVVVGIYIGKKDEKKCQDAVHTSILFSMIIGLIISILGMISSKYLLELLNTSKEVISKSTLYMQIYFCGSIFNMIYNFGAAILRAKGETKKPLYYLTIAGIINVFLNLFFVTVLKMDVSGVAIATIASQAISAILVIRLLINNEGYVNLNLKKLRIDKESLKDIILIGLPAGIQNSLFSISNVFIQGAVNSFNSTAAVAGNTAASSIGGFIYTSMTAFNQASMTFTSQNVGAKKIVNCKKVLMNCMMCVTVTGLVLGGTIALLSKPLLSIYVSGAEALMYGKARLVVVATTYFICGIAEVLIGSIRAMGYSFIPMIVSILGICGFRLFWIYTVFKANHTMQTLYLSYPTSWLLTGFIHLITFISVYKKIKNNTID